MTAPCLCPGSTPICDETAAAAPGRNRTRNRELRNLALCPVELRRRIGNYSFLLPSTLWNLGGAIVWDLAVYLSLLSCCYSALWEDCSRDIGCLGKHLGRIWRGLHHPSARRFGHCRHQIRRLQSQFRHDCLRRASSETMHRCGTNTAKAFVASRGAMPDTTLRHRGAMACYPSPTPATFQPPEAFPSGAALLLLLFHDFDAIRLVVPRGSTSE